MTASPGPVHISAVARTNTNVRIGNVAVAQRVSSKHIVEAILPKITTPDCEPYAIDLIVPTTTPGVDKTLRYETTGRSLDARKIAVAKMPDGRSWSISGSEDDGRTWTCIGVVANKVMAHKIGEKWQDGSLELPFTDDDLTDD